MTARTGLVSAAVLLAVVVAVGYRLLEDRGPVVHFRIAQVRVRPADVAPRVRLSFGRSSVPARRVMVSVVVDPLCGTDDVAVTNAATLTLPNGRRSRNASPPADGPVAGGRILGLSFRVSRDEIAEIARGGRPVTLTLPMGGSCGDHTLEIDLAPGP